MTDPLQVQQYLLDHPDFFNQFPHTLTALRLPHNERGAVSLVERQQQLLRQRVGELEEEITALLSMARRNEEIHRFFSDLLFELLAIDNMEQMITTLAAKLKQQFRFASVQLFQRQAEAQFTPSSIDTILKQRLDSRGYYLGRLPAQEASILVGIETGSVALIGLGDPKQWHGVLAIASQDPSHFSPEMGTMLIDNLQQLLRHRLQHG